MPTTTRKRLLAEIRTRSGSGDGEVVVVYEYVTVTQTTFTDASLRQLSKVDRGHFLADGRPVDRVDDSTFQVARTGEILRKI
jgi:hypothetical protein